MVFITSNSNSPSYNLAWEEYILKYLYDGETVFLLWRNEPSLIIGRNQNVYEEANLLYLHQHNIPLFRRNSGGGAVYHDLGNLNFTFITQAKGYVNQYEKLLKPILDALNTLNIKAMFHPKSDVYIQDKKIGGNAQFIYKDRLLHHGTLLFDSDLNHLNHVLKTKSHSESGSVKSRRATVTNIKTLTDLTMDAFMTKLKALISPELKHVSLTEDDERHIQQLKQSKYLTLEWNYFESPKSVIVIQKNTLDITLHIDQGHINDVSIYQAGIQESQLEKQLLNQPFLIDTFLPLKHQYPVIFNVLFD